MSIVARIRPRISTVRSTMEAKGRNGTVGFDGALVSIVRSGFIARTTTGKGEKRLPIGQISAVQVKPASSLVHGYISFSMPGGAEKQATFGSQTYDAYQDENAVVFTKKQQPAFLDLREEVEQALVALHTPAEKGTAVAGDDPASQLRRLTDLRDEGLITPEEFAQKRAEIIDRM